jgi:hypothetical protein
MYIGLHVKYCYSRQILMKHEISRQIFEKLYEIRPVAVQLFHADGQTDMTKLRVP